MYDSKTFKLTSAGKRFFGTKKNTLRIIALGADGGVELNGGYWDGGSRSEYLQFNRSGTISMINYPTAPQLFGGSKPPTVSLTDEFAIVRGGVFCGKVAGLTLYVTKHDGWMRPEYGTEVVK